MFGFLKQLSRKKFGEIAILKGYISKKDVKEALSLQREHIRKDNTHKQIGAILMEKGILTAGDIEKILENQKDQKSIMAWFAALFGLSR